MVVTAETMKGERLFGQIAVKKMFITQDEIEAAVRKQKSFISKGVLKRLGAILVDEGLLTPDQVKEILAIQNKAGEDGRRAEIRSSWVFGRVAVALGILSPEQANEAAVLQEDLEGEGIALKFGEVLVKKGIIGRAEVQQVLDAQWARGLDPDDMLFGAIAVTNGFIAPDALREHLQLQQELAEELSDPTDVPKIAELLLIEEQMQPPEVEAVLKVQERLKARASIPPPKILRHRGEDKGALKARNADEALFFKVAVRNRFFTADRVTAILEKQQSDPRPRSAAEIAVELGLLDRLDVAAVQEVIGRREGVKQRREKHRAQADVRPLEEDVEFCKIAQTNGFVTEDHIQRAEKTFKALHAMQVPRNMGEILFDMGVLTAEQARAVFDIQRLKGEVLPAYRLEETLLTEEEDEALLDFAGSAAHISQEQVTECLKIQRKLLRYGIRRKHGEIMVIKGYLFRDDLKRRPAVRRSRDRPLRAGSGRHAVGSRTRIYFAVGAAVTVGVLLLMLVLILGKGNGEPPEPSPREHQEEEVLESEETMKTPAEPSGPPPGKDPVELGYIQWKGRWIHKEKFKAESRRKFYESLRREVAAR